MPTPLQWRPLTRFITHSADRPRLPLTSPAWRGCGRVLDLLAADERPRRWRRSLQGRSTERLGCDEFINRASSLVVDKKLPSHVRAFLSHASEDKAGFVEPLARQLAEMGIAPWLDIWEIRPGDSLVKKLFTEGLDTVCSTRSMPSSWWSRRHRQPSRGFARNWTRLWSGESTAARG